MGKLKGMDITLIVRTQSGADPFGAPIYTETRETVSNVLVGRPKTEDITDSLQLYGKRAEYELGIPKGDTHEWKDCVVEFFGRRFRSFGFVREGIEENVPLEWHKTVMVESYE